MGVPLMSYQLGETITHINAAGTSTSARCLSWLDTGTTTSYLDDGEYLMETARATFSTTAIPTVDEEAVIVRNGQSWKVAQIISRTPLVELSLEANRRRAFGAGHTQRQ